ncbi:MAG: hypothetical protein ACE5NG_12320 [bacterium]
MSLHSNKKGRRWNIIAVFFMICFLFQWGGVAVAQESPSVELGEAKKMDAVLAIDNSGSMDWQGHDPKGSRFEGAKIFIDKSEEGDNIALVDFSGSSLLLLPLTKVTRERKRL